MGFYEQSFIKKVSIKLLDIKYIQHVTAWTRYNRNLAQLFMGSHVVEHHKSVEYVHPYIQVI